MNLLDLVTYYEKIEEFQPGETIFKQGEPGDQMYIVFKGKVDLKVNDQTIYSAGEGEFFGEMALIDAKSRSATAVAGEYCRLVSVGEKQFLFLVQKKPEFSLLVLRTMADRLRSMDTKL